MFMLKFLLAFFCHFTLVRGVFNPVSKTQYRHPTSFISNIHNRSPHITLRNQWINPQETKRRNIPFPELQTADSEIHRTNHKSNRFRPLVRSHSSSNIEDSKHELPDITPKWTTMIEYALTPENLRRLFNNEIPAIRVPGFLSQQVCDRIVDIIHNSNMDYYRNVNPPIGHIGITQLEYKKDPNGYFSQVIEAERLQQQFAKDANIDPKHMVIDLLRDMVSKQTPVEIASEGPGRTYFAGILQALVKSAGLHANYAPYDAPDWLIGKIKSQITWNIYLTDVPPKAGGVTTVYNRYWEGPKDDRLYKDLNSYAYSRHWRFPKSDSLHKDPNSYGYIGQWKGRKDDSLHKDPNYYSYSHRVVKNAPSIKLEPGIGDLVIFNSRNYHEVSAPDSEIYDALQIPQQRLCYTLSSFVGLLHENNEEKLLLWS